MKKYGEANMKNNNENRNRAQLGFSLVELIIVIAIMAILLGVVAPQFVSRISKSRKDACERSREGIARIVERCVMDSTSGYTLDDITVNKIVKGEYAGLSDEDKARYVCPKGGTYEAWVQDESDVGATNYGVICVKCDECDTVVSVDTQEFVDPYISPSADKPVPTPAPTLSPEADEFFTVTFDCNGHGYDPSPQKVKKNDRIDPTAIGSMIAKGWTFVGWYKESEGINAFDLNTPITADIKLYAKWKGVNGGLIWPYADDDTWWDPSKFNHDDEVVDYQLGGTTNNMYIVINTPSGIFTSKNGGQFVFVRKDGTKKIYFYEAMTPEYYSALNPGYLIQLTGTEYNYNLNDYRPGGAEYVAGNRLILRNISNGDLVTFYDDDYEYTYVWWEGSSNSVVIEGGKIDAILKYDPNNKPDNLQQVNPQKKRR